MQNPTERNGRNAEQQTKHGEEGHALREVAGASKQDDPNGRWNQRNSLDTPNRQEPRNNEEHQ